MDSGLSVLVVDDEVDVAVAVERQLCLLGHTARHVAGGAEALDAVESGAYDLVLCDLVMPGMDGHAWLREANRRGVTTPVVMMSGRADIVDAIQAQRAGSVDFLIKPFSRRQLERGIERARTPAPMRLEATPSGVHRGRRASLVEYVASRFRVDGAEASRLARLYELLDRRPLEPEVVLRHLSEDVDLEHAVMRYAQLSGANAGDVAGAVESLGPATAVGIATARTVRAHYTEHDPEMNAIELHIWCVHYVSSALLEMYASSQAWPRPERMAAMLLMAQLGELCAVRAARALWPASFGRGGPDDEVCDSVLCAAGEAAETVCEAWDLPRYFVSFARAWHDPVARAAASRSFRRVADVAAWARYRTERVLGPPVYGAAPFAPCPSGLGEKMAELLVEKAVERIVVFG